MGGELLESLARHAPVVRGKEHGLDGSPSPPVPGASGAFSEQGGEHGGRT
jgi:hypothetical protein